MPGVRGAEAAGVFYLETFDALELWPPAFVDLRLAAQSLSSAFGMEAEVLDYWYKPGR